MSKSVFCYQHNIERYDADTSDLNLIQHGAYSRLIQAYYRSKGQLPADLKKLSIILRCQNKAERETVAYIVDRFFTVGEDGYLRQNGAEKELERILKLSEAQRRKSFIKHLKDKETPSATAEPRQSHGTANYKLSTNNTDSANAESAPVPPKSSDDLFDEKPQTKAKRNPHELPPDFQPDESCIALAKQLGINLDEQLAEVRDWAASKRPKYADWQATFRNVIRRAAKSRPTNANRGFSQRPEPQGVVAAALRVAARHTGNNTP